MARDANLCEEEELCQLKGFIAAVQSGFAKLKNLLCLPFFNELNLVPGR